MRPFVDTMSRELGPTLRLAAPVVLAELGWVAMAIVDAVIVGRLGAGAIGAVSLGVAMFFVVAVVGMGMLLGLDTLVSQAFGAGRPDVCRGALVQGVYLALVLTPALTVPMLAGASRMGVLGVDPTVLRLAVPYLEATAWSLGPLLIYTALRRYLQATGRVGPVVFALVSANLINALANWALVFGRLGAPSLGVVGSAWATTASRVYMAAVLAAYVVRHDRLAGLGPGRVSLRPDRAVMARLVALGLPAAAQMTLEWGAFAVATILAGRLDPVALAAHQIVLNVACVTFMIPLGLSTAAAVRVGQAIGRRDGPSAARAGWTAIALGAGFMACSGLTFLLAPRTILAAFTDDPAVVATGLSLLGVAACFQLFDGLQGVTTGALRGAGDTRTPMLANLLAHWSLGLPIGYTLAFRARLGVFGLWVGLSIGLVAAGLILVRLWTLRARALTRAVPPEKIRAT